MDIRKYSFLPKTFIRSKFACLIIFKYCKTREFRPSIFLLFLKDRKILKDYYTKIRYPKKNFFLNFFKKINKFTVFLLYTLFLKAEFSIVI